MCQPTTEFLDIRSHGMSAIVQEEGRLSCGRIHGIVHSELRHGQHLVPSVLTIPGKGSEVIFQCPVHYLCLTVRLWMERRTHFLLHFPLFREPTEEC